MRLLVCGQSLVRLLGVFTLDFLEILPLKCSIHLNHHHYLLIRTLIPLVLLLLSLLYRKYLRASAMHKRVDAAKGGEDAATLSVSADADDSTADQTITNMFILFYLLFPSNSSKIFATFGCETLDDPGQSTFLRVDFSVDCNTLFHTVMTVYAGVMVVIYPFGIPAMYAYLLFYKHGDALRLLRRLEIERMVQKEAADATVELSAARARVRVHASPAAAAAPPAACGGGLPDTDAAAKHPTEIVDKMERLQKEEDAQRARLPDYVQKLILGYELRTYYFELVECVRKLAIVCLPVLFGVRLPLTPF